jgi:hypothetical protein
LNFPVYKRS